MITRYSVWFWRLDGGCSFDADGMKMYMRTKDFPPLLRSPATTKKMKHFRISSMVGDCIETSNPFLNDFEVVIFFVEWIESPALCQREGTEGRECKYFSPAKLKPTFAKIGGGIDLAMLVATSHRKLFPFVGGFKRKEYVFARGIGYCAPCGRFA